MKNGFFLIGTHVAMAMFGFALGIYTLPILSEPPPPDASALASAVSAATYRGEFRRDLADSDHLHWGEGTVHVGRSSVALQGTIAPGPAYKLYLSPDFIDTEVEFLARKAEMVAVGDVKNFDNFIVPMPASVNPDAFTTVIIWCEAFDEFITAAKYR